MDAVVRIFVSAWTWTWAWARQSSRLIQQDYGATICSRNCGLEINGQFKYTHFLFMVFVSVLFDARVVIAGG